jgi:hypothetical protein
VRLGRDNFELNYDIVLIWASRYLDLFFVGAIF